MKGLFHSFALALLGAASAFQSPTRKQPPRSTKTRATRPHAWRRSNRPSTALSLIELDKVPERSITEGIFGTMFDSRKATSVERFFDAWNRQDMDVAVAQFSEDCLYEDGTYYRPFKGRNEMKRMLLLRQDATLERVEYIIDDLAISSTGEKIGVKYHLEINGIIIPDSRHCAFYTIDLPTGLINSCYDVVEPAQKAGAVNLAILNGASKIIGKGDKESVDDGSNSSSSTVSSSERKEYGW